ncbi:DUF4189 domain-containing protein [Rhizobium sp. LjRoot254]|uniref:DUF4189 domain-containing protein n=1 Tax=Rhizobium sp. LjRoot254 TaxID=3342297 RepID=UPI003ED0BFBB
MKTFSKFATVTAALAMLAVPAIASAADYYGAFAFSQKTGASGWSKNYGSQGEAEGAALQVCFQTQGASDCKVSYSFVNSCAALAVGGDNGWGADWGTNVQAAENKAMHTCSGYSYNCKVITSQCSNGS